MSVPHARFAIQRKKRHWGPLSAAKQREQARQLDCSKLIFIDESGSNIALTPLYGRARSGERAYGSIPRNRGTNTTLLASLSVQGMGEALIVERAATSGIFETYIERVLGPSL